MAEWFKALVKGISYYGGVGSSPTPVILLTLLYKELFPLYEHLHMVCSTILNAID